MAAGDPPHRLAEVAGLREVTKAAKRLQGLQLGDYIRGLYAFSNKIENRACAVALHLVYG